MKNTKSILAILAAAAVCLASCAKEEIRLSGENAPAQDVEYIQMDVNADMSGVKTTFCDKKDGAYPILWSAKGESVRLYEKIDNSAWGPKNFSVNYESSEDLKSAKFKINITPQSADRFDYYVVYPGDGRTYQITQADNKTEYLDIIRMGNIDVQTPDANGVDHKFTFLVGKQEALEKQPATINVDFKHILSYGKMTVKNLPLVGQDTVSTIKIMFNNRTHITGFIDYHISKDEVVLTKSNSSSKGYIEINTKNIKDNKTSFDVWFAIPPTTLETNESVSFSFQTKSGDLTHTVTMPSPMEFKRGEATSFTIDASDAAIPLELKLDMSTVYDILPTGVKTPDANRQYFNLPVVDSNSGKTYWFRNSGGLYHSGTNAWCTLYDGSSTGYLGLPAVPGYKLTKITATRGENQGAEVKLEVLSDIANGTKLTSEIVWAKGSKTPAPIMLEGTKENTVYYIHSLSNSYVPLGTFTLTYEIAKAEDAHPTDYEVYLLLGDYNMLGKGETLVKTDCTPTTGVYTFTNDSTVVYGAQPLFNIQSSVRNAYTQHRFSMAGPFGEEIYAKNGNKKVLLVCNARGLAPIKYWHHGAETLYYAEATGDEQPMWGMPVANLFDQAVARAKAAMKYGELKAIIWHHGETDSSVEASPLYMNELKNFVSELRTALGKSAAELPFICGELNRAEEGATRFNACIANVPTEISNSGVVSSEDCASNNNTNFFSKDGSKEFGKRYATKYFDLTTK